LTELNPTRRYQCIAHWHFDFSITSPTEREPFMKTGNLYQLPSNNVIRVTGVVKEDVKSLNDHAGQNDVVTAVYERADSTYGKTLSVLASWFTKFAIPITP
jgi:hypothetical protein